MKDLLSENYGQSIEAALEMEHSMRQYAEEMTRGDLDEFLRGFAKRGVILDGRFVLLSFLSKGWQAITSQGQGHFNVDGNFSFALGYQKPGVNRPLWIAVASIATARIASEYRSMLADEEIETDYEPDKPLIVQLQGPGTWNYDNEAAFPEATDALSKLKWERALVGLVVDWAQKSKAGPVYILPGKYNLGLDNTNKDEVERFKMRYDVTALRMGFRRQGEGFYKKEIGE